MNTKSFETYNPLLGIEDDLLLAKQFGAVTAAIRLELPKRFTMTVLDYQVLNNLFVQVVDACVQFSGHIILHKQDVFSSKTSQLSKPEGPEAYLDWASHWHFLGRPYLSQETFLFISLVHPNYGELHPLKTFISKPSIHPAYLEKETKANFQSLVDGILAIWNSSPNITAKRLRKKALLGTEKCSGIVESYLSLFTNNKGLTDIGFDHGGVQSGIQTGCFYSVEQLHQIKDQLPLCGRYRPYETEVTTFPISTIASLGAFLPYEHLVNQYLYIGDTESNVERIKRKERKFARYALNGSDENAIYAEDLSVYRRKLTETFGHSIKFYLNVLVHTGNSKELSQLREATEKAFNSAGLRPKLNSIDRKNLFYAGIPGNAVGLSQELYMDMTPEEAASICLWEGSGTNTLDDPKGIRLCDRLSGRPLSVDLLHRPKQMGLIDNYNMTVVSGTGGGKSYFMNHYLRWVYGQGGHVFIIDAGKSYELQTQYHDGLFFEYRPEQPLVFNPFVLHKGSNHGSKRKVLSALLALLAKGNTVATTKLEDSIYLGLIDGYYLQKQQGHGFDSFYRFAQGFLPQFLKEQNIRHTDFDPAVFLTTLLPYYHGGSLDFLLNAKDKRLSQLGRERWVVFEIDGIREDALLFPIVSLLITESYTQKLFNPQIKGILKTIVFDEAWAAIAQKNLAGYIRYLVKTVRKHFGQTVFISQEPEDFLAHPLIQNAIVNNSDLKVFLDLSKYQNQFSRITKPMGFTARQAQQILSLNKQLRSGTPYKELAICWKELTKVYGLETSLMEKALYETDPSQKPKILKYYEESGSLEWATRQYAEEENHKNKPL